MDLEQAPFRTSGAHEELICEVQGQLPDELQGTLLRTTPAGLNRGSWRAEHWFDGLCLLYRFSLGEKPSFKSAWLQSEYLTQIDSGRVTMGAFGTKKQPGFFEWLLHPIGDVTDNANVNVAKYGERYVALTESMHTHEIDPLELQSRGWFKYQGDVPAAAMPTAHPRYHFEKKSIINLASVLGGRSTIFVVEQQADGSRRELNRLQVQEWPYIHDFGLTENYAILMAHPCTLKPWQMLWEKRGLASRLHYDPTRGAQLILLPLDGGKARRFDVDGCFVFHFFNAFEQDGEVIVDVAAHREADPLTSLSTQNLRNGEPTLGGFPTRYRLDLRTGKAQCEELCSTLCEFPQIAYRRCHGRPYRYGYGASPQQRGGQYESHLIKLDTVSGSVRSFFDAEWIPGEALFVPRRDAQSEDDGYLLSVASHREQERTRLFVLDAKTLTERATVEAPVLMPIGFHGQFFPGL